MGRRRGFLLHPPRKPTLNTDASPLKALVLPLARLVTEVLALIDRRGTPGTEMRRREVLKPRGISRLARLQNPRTVLDVVNPTRELALVAPTAVVRVGAVAPVLKPL